MGFFKNFFGKRSTPEEIEREKEHHLLHSTTEKLILDCERLIKKLNSFNDVKDQNTRLKINWVVNRVAEIKNHLEESHSYLKEENLAYFEKELFEANKIINKNFETIYERLDFLKRIKRITSSEVSYFKSLVDNIQRLIKELNKK